MTLTEWRVHDLATGEVTTHRLVAPPKHRGRKPKVATIRERMIGEIRFRAPLNSVRYMIDGREQSVVAARDPGPPFPKRVDQHHRLLRKRRHPISAELMPPVGQAAGWYAEVELCVPRSGREVARQLARLCGNDSRVTVPLSSLADAVGRADKAGRHIAYSQRGITALVESGWLTTETTGPRGGQRTTYYLQAGDRRVSWFPLDADDWAAETEQDE